MKKHLVFKEEIDLLNESDCYSHWVESTHHSYEKQTVTLPKREFHHNNNRPPVLNRFVSGQANEFKALYLKLLKLTSNELFVKNDFITDFDRDTFEELNDVRHDIYKSINDSIISSLPNRVYFNNLISARFGENLKYSDIRLGLLEMSSDVPYIMLTSTIKNRGVIRLYMVKKSYYQFEILDVIAYHLNMMNSMYSNFKNVSDIRYDIKIFNNGNIAKDINYNIGHTRILENLEYSGSIKKNEYCIKSYGLNMYDLRVDFVSRTDPHAISPKISTHVSYNNQPLCNNPLFGQVYKPHRSLKLKWGETKY